MNLVNHLATRAAEHPKQIALIDAERSMTYEELYGYVCGGSEKLMSDGHKPGDIVCILQPVGIPLYISLLGAFHAGLTVMFVDPSAGKEMIRNSLSLVRPQIFIGTGKAHLLRLTIPEIRKIESHYHSTMWMPFSRSWQPARAELFPPFETQADSPALITFTSGSTGMPKAACRTHGFLLSQHKALAESLDYREKEVDLVTLPVFTLANLASGVTSVLADTDLRYPARADSRAIESQCEKHSVTRCAASPAFFAKLHNDKRLPNFKTIYTGGAPVFPGLLDEIQASRPGMKVVTVFGSTEAEPIAHISWTDTSREDKEMMQSGCGLLVGKPVDATELRIIPDETGTAIGPLTEAELNDLQLQQGETGEIIVTGDHVLKGYLNGQGNDENKIKVGDSVWHRTGDAAWLDESGRVWLVGRCSAAIQRDEQEPVYPFGIECAAMGFPGVKRCALVLFEERVTLLIEGALDSGEQRELLNTTPVEKVKFVENIPVDKRHNSKIDYPELYKRLLR